MSDIQPATPQRVRPAWLKARLPRDVWLSRRTIVPRRRSEKDCELFERAVCGVFPWALGEYPGRWRGLGALLGGKASQWSLRAWWRGKRRAPVWALRVLRGRLVDVRDQAAGLVGELDRAIAAGERWEVERGARAKARLPWVKRGGK